MNGMQLNKRQIWIIAIVLLMLIVMTIVMAPSGGSRQLTQGSTYSRSPDGYGAWYAFMQERDTPLQRWQKPLKTLFQPSQARSNLTLLRIGNGVERLGMQPLEEEWVKRGNVLVLLGVQARSTEAPFSSDLPSPVGQIRIETSRRQANPEGQVRLNDDFGAVVWQRSLGQGQVIYASTPFLAANAYQDFRPNYEFLANLVTEPNLPLWVDEYMHGYQDQGDATSESLSRRATPVTLLGYLAGTPVLLVMIQAIVLLAVLIWGLNRRLGPAIAVTPPTVNNSEAYMQALAGALYKAECSEFVLETVGKAEQLHIQQALGLGNSLLPLETVVAAWVQQTGRPAAELEATLRMANRQRRVSEAELLRWLNDLQTVRQHLPSQ
ncbi:DUF4350 domain-containing protein [Pantanalinema rosaneae CENA516]|uniref:DUF4350 domain-containing protein n=1 Tax=Pantanalinema rosaneae TaxID=1620701 RepID=UPI003D6FA5D6